MIAPTGVWNSGGRVKTLPYREVTNPERFGARRHRRHAGEGETMKTCVIFGAAEFDGLVAPVGQEDFIIAADGGLVHTENLGLTPDLILGDFDSLGYVPQGARVYPVEKDDTDSMLAVRLGLEAGCRRFVLYGALDGPRLDHTVANLQTLLYLSNHGARGFLVGKNQIVTTIREETVAFPKEFAGIFSLFAMGQPAEGITLRNLQYCLADGTLDSGFPLGVSNHFLGQAASVAVKRGTLLAIYDTANGLLPEDAAC